MPALATPSPATLPHGLAHRLAQPVAPDPSAPPDLLPVLRAVTLAGVRSNQPDLSARQLAVFLTVYLEPAPQTVRGLAATLNVSKPAITRALDRLGKLDLIRRQVDPQDRRSLLVGRTLFGTSTLSALRHSCTDAWRECGA